MRRVMTLEGSPLRISSCRLFKSIILSVCLASYFTPVQFPCSYTSFSMFASHLALWFPSHAPPPPHTCTATHILKSINNTFPSSPSSHWGISASICRGVASCLASSNPWSLQHRDHSGQKALMSTHWPQSAWAWEERPRLIGTVKTLKPCRQMNLKITFT